MRTWLFLKGMLYGAAIVLVLAWLGGCAETPVKPVPNPTTVVNVPVPTACVATADIPPLPTPTPIDLAHATPSQKAAAVAADAEAYASYAAVVSKILLQCSLQLGGSSK